jgi:hypothetical protein
LGIRKRIALRGEEAWVHSRHAWYDECCTIGCLQLSQRGYWTLVPYAVALLAFCATASVGQAPGKDVTTLIAAQRFAKRFTETSSVFRPGNTTAYVDSLGRLANFLISTTPFEAKVDAAFNNFGKLDGQSLYVLIDRRLASESCLIEANKTFAVVPLQCVGKIPSGVDVQ